MLPNSFILVDGNPIFHTTNSCSQLLAYVIKSPFKLQGKGKEDILRPTKHRSQDIL